MKQVSPTKGYSGYSKREFSGDKARQNKEESFDSDKIDSDEELSASNLVGFR